MAAKHADLILLDEPTVHLDSETAAQIVQAVKTFAQGRTLIVATHDPLLIACMDRSIDVSRPRHRIADERKRA